MTSESTTSTPNGTDVDLHQTSTVESTPDGVSIETHPVIRPTLISLGVLVVAVLAIVGYLALNPTLFGDRQTTSIVVNILSLLGVIGTVHYLVRIFIYLRTSYHITEDGVSREYQLFMRTKQRGVPHSRIRSHEMRQTRLQYLLGYGDIIINDGLGTLRLSDIRDPQVLHARIQEFVEDE